MSFLHGALGIPKEFASYLRSAWDHLDEEEPIRSNVYLVRNYFVQLIS